MRGLSILAVFVFTAFTAIPCGADDGGANKDLASPDAIKSISTTGPDVVVTPGAAGSSGFAVTIQPGEAKFPGIALKPTGGYFDFSAFGYVEARITNTGSEQIGASLRTDNMGRGGYWNDEDAKIPAGQTVTIRDYFSKPVDGFEPSKVTQILVYTGKVSGSPTTLRVESLTAGGKPGDRQPVKPADTRTKPVDGVIYAAGNAVEPAQLAGKNGGAMSFQEGGLEAVLPASAPENAVATFSPLTGGWDLQDQLEVRVSLKNTGSVPITPRVRLDSRAGPSDTISAPSPIAPGGEVEIVVPFVAVKPWTMNSTDEKELPSSKNIVEGTGESFLSNTTRSIAISASPAGVERRLLVTSIKADMLVATIPDWLGKRPPVEGDWVQTFDEEFKGSTIDASKWNVVGENWYDKISHYSAQNVIVDNGSARIHEEKKTGYANDDPKSYQTDYASGYLDTLDKFAQRYGYFEARIKVPRTPGTWPAFWLMPDRPGTERKGIRGRTSDGGMEFDIMEHLAVWGPYRYNVAMHWDGYGKDHKATGSKVYYLPDKDGYITAGLLWTPGSAVFYANGSEVVRFNSPRVASVPENIIFNMALGGWDNNHLDPQNLQLPSDLVINYVRVWQRKDLATADDTVNSSTGAK